MKNHPEVKADKNSSEATLEMPTIAVWWEKCIIILTRLNSWG